MSENQLSNSAESFISYLNSEIEQIREDIKLPGWTNWAILAALASIGWFSILEVEKNIFNLNQIYLLFILLSLAYAISRDLYEFFKPNRSTKRIRYLTTDILFQEKRLVMVVGIIRAFIMVFLLIHFSTQAGRIAYYLALFYYGVIIFSPAIVLLMDKLVRGFANMSFYIPDSQNYAIPSSFSPRAKNIYRLFKGAFAMPWVFMFIIVFYSLLAYALLYYNLYGIAVTLVTISSLKIAIFAFSMFLLLGLWLHNEQTSPTLRELIQIRRDLMFGNVSLEMARKLTEISISGLNKSAIFQREITNCISTLQGIDTELSKAVQKNQIVSSEWVDNTNAEDLDAQQILWQTIRDATLVHFRQARAIYLADKSLRGGIEKFLTFYAPMEPEDTGYIDSIRKMYELYDQVKHKYDKTISDWLNHIVRYEGESASRKWRKIAMEELEAELPQVLLIEKNAG